VGVQLPTEHDPKFASHQVSVAQVVVLGVVFQSIEHDSHLLDAEPQTKVPTSLMVHSLPEAVHEIGEHAEWVP
jgi:hypothetical protein